MNARNVEDYMRLPYTIEVVRDDDEENPGWVARVVELPGCITQGDTFEELGEMVEDAMRGWIEVALEDGIPIPEPRPVEEYSGKFVVRVPKSLHRELVEAAGREGISLNAFVSVALGRAVGAEFARTETKIINERLGNFPAD
jgi:antitoxin HicB